MNIFKYLWVSIYWPQTASFPWAYCITEWLVGQLGTEVRKKMSQKYGTFQRLPSALSLHRAQQEFVAVLLWVIHCLTSCLLIIVTLGRSGQRSCFTSSSLSALSRTGQGNHLQEGKRAAAKLSQTFPLISVTEEERGVCFHVFILPSPLG